MIKNNTTGLAINYKRKFDKKKEKHYDKKVYNYMYNSNIGL